MSELVHNVQIVLIPLASILLEFKVSDTLLDCYFIITLSLYLSSHFSYSCAAFCKIAQTGGGGQAAGE